MKKLLVALFVGMPLVGCTEETIVKKVPASSEGDAAANPEQSTEGTEPALEDAGDAEKPKPTGPDHCLDGQDMDAADVDVSTVGSANTASRKSPAWIDIRSAIVTPSRNNHPHVENTDMYM